MKKYLKKIIQNIENSDNKVKYITLFTHVFALILLYSCSTQTQGTIEFQKLLNQSKRDLNSIDTNYIEQKARDFFIKGSTLQQQQRFAEAILEFQQALKYDSSSSILYAMALNYKNLDKLDLALEYSINSYEIDSSFIPNIELMADIYIAKYKIDNALTVLQHAVDIDPSRQRKKQIAQLYEFKDIKKAISLYEDLIKETSDYDVLQRLARLYRQNNENKKFIETSEKLFDFNPNARTATAIINAYLEEKEYSKVVNFLEKLNNSLNDEELANGYGIVGSALYRDSMSDSLELIPMFLKIIGNQFYFDWKIQILKGILYFKTKDEQKSEQCFRHVLSIADTIVDVPIQIGVFYLDNNEDNKALELFSNYEKEFPGDVRYPLFIGISFVNLSKLNEAVTPLNRALEIDSTSLETWTQLGIIYDRLGKTDSSDFAYDKALRQEPFNALVNNNYAYSLSERGVHLNRAIEMSKIAIQKDSNNSAYLDTYGWILFKKGDYDGALEYTLKSIEKGRASAEVYEHLGNVYIKLDDIEKAKKAWQMALDKEPNRINLKEKLKNIK